MERLYHRIAAVVTLMLIGMLVWDDLGNGSAWFVPLLLVLGAHLLIQLTVLLWLRPETEAWIEREIIHIVEADEDRAPMPPAVAAPVSVPADPVLEKPAAVPPFTFNGYTLHRTETTDKGGNARTFYFFSKRTPKQGVPSAKPADRFVGVNKRTGLPFLKRGSGTDGAALGAPERKAAQCQALTRAGKQCKFASRDRSKYCARHHGYRPPAKGTLGRGADTKPLRRGSVDTKPSVRS